VVFQRIGTTTYIELVLIDILINGRVLFQINILFHTRLLSLTFKLFQIIVIHLYLFLHSFNVAVLQTLAITSTFIVPFLSSSELAELTIDIRVFLASSLIDIRLMNCLILKVHFVPSIDNWTSILLLFNLFVFQPYYIIFVLVLF